MSYRWRGWTPRHEALRQWADAQWQRDQHAEGQRRWRGIQPRDRHARVLAYEMQKLDQEERTP